MVSPSKIFKTSNSGFKLGIDSSKRDYLTAHGGSRQKTSSHSKNSHPLANTKFYLDIRNKAQLAKVESTLKSYGAKIEVFFGEDIKVVVTDKAQWIGSCQSPTASLSPFTTPSPSSNQDQRFILPKSRASAMLEKVSRQSTSPYCSPLELAQKWKIPVLPVPALWKWIAKVEEVFLAKLNEKKKGKDISESEIVSHARDSPFIKIESSVSLNIPEFLVLGSWPRLNLDGHLGQCPFRSPSPSNPSFSDEESKEVENKLDVKDKVAVEVIKYDTNFRIKDTVRSRGCETVESAEIEISRKQDGSSFEGLNGVGFRRKTQVVTLSNLSSDRKRCFHFQSKMTRRPGKSNLVNNEDDAANIADARVNSSPFCNGHTGRAITRQSSHELLKVQCNGLTTSHRNSKLLSPSGSDVLPLPTSRRSTRRASASWCGSTRELSQLSPTDSEIENIRRSDSSFEAHDPSLDSPGITLRPKQQLWLPIALIGTTAEENGNGIRKRYEYSIRQSENAKFSGDSVEQIDEKIYEGSEENLAMPIVGKESDSSFNSHWSSPNDYEIKRGLEKKDTYCIITRNTKNKNDEINGRSRESSIETHSSGQESLLSRTVGKKRSLSVCGQTSPSFKRARTLSTNSVHSVRKKKLSPEEKLLQDNKEYFKMEVLNTKLRSSGSLLNMNQNKDLEPTLVNFKPEEKIGKIVIKKIKVRGRRKKNKWTKTSEKKEDVKFGTVFLEAKKNTNVKINGVIRRKRQSELMKLCNEAESFMFGESSRHTTGFMNSTENDTENCKKKKNNLPFASEFNTNESPIPDCKSKNLVLKARKKRRSHAEAFIHDNQDYYKFETPGSRLRYQGSASDTKAEDRDFIYTLKPKKKDKHSMENMRKNDILGFHLTVDIKEERIEHHEKRKNVFKPSEEIEKILFSFESIPKAEPWYAVYKRQDEGMENYYPLLSDPNDQPFLLPYELPKPNYAKIPTVAEYYKRRRKKLAHLFNHPRKSPRCHASTLAILSSLKRRKRRSGTNISINSMLPESLPENSQPSNDKFDTRSVESDKKNAESEEVLDFLFKSDSDSEIEEILLEPLCSSESKPKRENSESEKSVKSDDEDIKNSKSGNRNKKLPKFENQSECDVAKDEEKQFLLQTIQPDSFIKDLVIEIKKKSGLNVSIATILENFRKCRSMEDSTADLIFDLNGGGSAVESLPNHRRRRKKARKINKTGWDNKKHRRKTDSKIMDTTDAESEKVMVKSKRLKIKAKKEESGINLENILASSKRRVKKDDGKNSENDTKPLLRSHLERGSRLADLRRVSQDSESRSESLDSREFPPCVVRVRKISNSSLGPKLRCSNVRYSLQKRRLMLSRKKKRVIDYAWSTKRRR